MGIEGYKTLRRLLKNTRLHVGMHIIKISIYRDYIQTKQGGIQRKLHWWSIGQSRLAAIGGATY